MNRLSFKYRMFWLLLLAALTACTRVVESVPLQPALGPLGYAPTCNSTLGAYYLPRALLHIKAQSDGTTLSGSGIDPVQNVVADSVQTFCLDYLALPNSQDAVVVQRGASGLLSSISSNVVDRTPDIVKSLVSVGEDAALLGARSTTGSSSPTENIDLEFDPFVWNELMAANKALHHFGFCLYVEGHSFPSDGLSPAELNAAGQAWCNTPHPRFYRPQRDEYAALPVPLEVMQSGVVYRPNMVHKVVVMRKADPGGRGRWSTFQVKRIEMPNVSPVLSIGIDRAAFASRKTTLNFTNGVLTDVAIDKGSELVGFVGIPLAVAKAVAEVPGEIVTLRITDTNNQTALLNAQSSLIQAIASYQQTAGALPPSARSAKIAASADIRSARVFGGCTDGGGDALTCDKYARGGRP